MTDATEPGVRQGVYLAPALAAIVLAFAVDQGSKWLILHVVMNPPQVIPLLPILNLTLGFNTGISFGMFADSFAGAPLVLSGLKLIVVSLVVWWLLRVRTRIEAIALGLILGGALGNIADRVRLGAVVDFIDAHYGGWHWPTFNTADIVIVSGVLLLLVASTRHAKVPVSAPTTSGAST